MIRQIVKYIISFIALFLVQIFVLNQIEFAGYIRPYLYVLFLLLLPIDLRGWLVLLVAFFTGIVIDIFTQTPGMNASACLVLAFSRQYLLKLIAPREGYETGQLPRPEFFGWKWFFIYSLILVAIHHVWLFYAEVFHFKYFFSTLLRAIFSIVFTEVLILLTVLFFYNSRKSK